MANTYTTKTASLRATKADIRSLNTKNIKVNDKDVITAIRFDDSREIITQHDLWGTFAEQEGNEIVFNNGYIENPNGASPWRPSVIRVEDNKAYDSLDFVCNIETDKITNGEFMFSNANNYNCKLTEFKSDLSSLEYGNNMFSYNTNLASFNGDLKNYTGSKNSDENEMFKFCEKLSSFESDLSSLENGNKMFCLCSNLTKFETEMPRLKNGNSMFANSGLGKDLGPLEVGFKCKELPLLEDGTAMFSLCKELKYFKTNLPKLEDGTNMFNGCTNLMSFVGDLSSLTHGEEMFSGCDELNVFIGDLSSLKYGRNMFNSCGLYDFEFVGDLSSLENGYYMFYNTWLTKESLIHIAETIKTHSTSSGKGIHLGIFHKVDLEDARKLLTEIHNKGWNVYANILILNTDNQVEPELFDPTTGFIAGEV